MKRYKNIDKYRKREHIQRIIEKVYRKIQKKRTHLEYYRKRIQKNIDIKIQKNIEKENTFRGLQKNNIEHRNIEKKRTTFRGL